MSERQTTGFRLLSTTALCTTLAEWPWRDAIPHGQGRRRFENRIRRLARG